MTLGEFNALPSIMSSFPLTFDTGRQRWTHFSVSCNDCKRPVQNELTRGRVDLETVTDGYRFVRSTHYSVVAHALCQACNSITTACCILRDDMTATSINPKTGMVHIEMRQLTMIELFLDWCKSLFH